jgi:hypothetical protein
VLGRSDENGRLVAEQEVVRVVRMKGKHDGWDTSY